MTVITLNEDANLRDCLESVRWAEEIAVVDALSTDRTVAIAREYTDRVFQNPWPGFVEQKNFALDRTTHDWVLSIDADERASPALRQEIQAVLARPDHAEGYSIPRRNIFLGRWMRHGGWYPDRVLRLFRKSRGRFGGINPHALVELQGKVMKLEEPLLHLTYHSLSQYIEKQYRYACTAAQERLRRRPASRVGLPTLAARPILKFLETYVVKHGFLDGFHGLIAAVGATYFSFLKYAKVWDQCLRRSPRSQAERDECWWLEGHATSEIRSVELPVGPSGLSVLVITRNEEENIQQCLESVSWADEILVVDAFSDDRTAEISRRFAHKVYQNPWAGFPAQRNFGLERTSGKWILILDADERVTPEARKEILAAIVRADQEGFVAYQIPRRNYFFGRWLRWGGTFPDLQWRLFRRGFIRYDESTLDTPIIRGKTGIIRAPLDHFTGRTIQQRVRKLDAETTFKASETLVKRYRIGWADVTLRPAATFFKVYLLKQGFRDGLYGFVYATLASFYTFVRYVKAWELLNGERGSRSSNASCSSTKTG